MWVGIWSHFILLTKNGFSPPLDISKKILANISGLLDYNRNLRVHSVQNGQSSFCMLVLVELGNAISPPADRLVSAAVAAVATQGGCRELVQHKAVFSCPC